MASSNYFSMSDGVTFNPLRKDFNIAALQTFEEIIKTCIGPHGKLKTVQNVAGGYVTVTSSSQRLMHIISIKNVFLKLIAASIKVHMNSFGNDGLTCALLILKLMNNSSALIYPLPLTGKLYEYFGRIFIECMNTENNSCVINMDMSDLGMFQSIIYTILASKPGCILKQKDIQHLSFMLLKVYLDIVPCNFPATYSKNVNFISLEGTSCEKSCLYNGLLVRVSGTYLANLIHLLNKSNIKIVLFTISLSGDADFPVDNIEVTNDISVWEAVLLFLKNFVKKIIEVGVQIFACQKVIHPSIRKQLEDSDILVLDKLGFEAAKSLEYLSGSSNSSLFTEVSYGCLTNISKESIGKNDFLLLSNKSKPFWTFLICNFNEQAACETKVVCQQVISSLFRLLKKPLVCFGAGCTEVYTCRLLKKKIVENLDKIKQEIGCTTSQILEVLEVFLQSVTDVAVAIHQGSKLNFVTETVYGHLWKLNDGNFPEVEDKCLCGQHNALLIDSSKWQFLTKTLSTMAIDINDNFKKTEESLEKFVILDELSSKISAYSVAFETAALLSRVSMCISN